MDEHRERMNQEDRQQKLNRARSREFLQSPGVLEWLKQLSPTQFVGYDVLSCETKIVGIIVRKPKSV